MLINSAGINEIGDFSAIPMARIEALLATNLAAPIALTTCIATYRQKPRG